MSLRQGNKLKLWHKMENAESKKKKSNPNHITLHLKHKYERKEHSHDQLPEHNRSSNKSIFKHNQSKKAELILGKYVMEVQKLCLNSSTTSTWTFFVPVLLQNSHWGCHSAGMTSCRERAEESVSNQVSEEEIINQNEEKYWTCIKNRQRRCK